MLNMNILVVILLVVIQQTTQSYYKMDDYSNENCGNPSISLIQQRTKLDEVYPDNDQPFQNIFRHNKKKLTSSQKDQPVFVPVLLMSSSAFKDIQGGIFNFKDMGQFKINQSNKNRKLRLEDQTYSSGDINKKGLLSFLKSHKYLSSLKQGYQNKKNARNLLLLRPIFHQ